VFTGSMAVSGSVGVEVTSLNWSYPSLTPLQIRNASLYGYDAYELGLQTNAYFDGSWKHISTGVRPWQMQFGNDNAIKFSTAITGSAFGVITWTELMRITPSGNVGIGTSSPISPLHIYSANQNQASSLSTSYSNSKFRLEPFNTSGVGISMGLISPNINYLQGVYSDGSTIAPFTMQPYGGNVGIGLSTSPAYTLDVTGTGRYTSALLNTIQLTNTGVSHGMTGWAPTNTVGSLGSYDAAGNFAIMGFSSTAGQSGLSLFGFIGVTDPTDSVAAILLNAGKKSGTAQQALGAAETTLQLTNAGTAQITILGSGNVGIGTTTPPFKLSVAQDITNDTNDINSGQFMVCGATTNNKRLVIGYDTNGNGYGYIESAYYNSTWTYTALQPTAGNVVIGQTTDQGYKLAVNGQPGAAGYTAWANYSDVRLKENITDLEATNVLYKICAIRPVTFNYNELSGYNEATRARRISGFIAQELMEKFPDMVGTIKINDTEYYDTNLSNLNLYLVKAIQEQQAQIEAQQQQINTLLNK
jgi:hypothetical protein